MRPRLALLLAALPGVALAQGGLVVPPAPYTDAQAQAANASAIAQAQANAIAQAAANAAGSYMTPTGVTSAISASGFETAAAHASDVTVRGLPTYDITGTVKSPSHVVAWGCTLSIGACTITLTGSAAYTSSTTYFCWAEDQALSAILASESNVSGTSFKVYGTLSDAVRGGCIGW